VSAGKRLAYAIFRDPGADPVELADFPGVETLTESGLAVAYSRVGLEAATPTPERVEAFAAVVAALHRSRAVLPLRYGLLDGDDALRARLLGRRDALLSRLDAVADCDEMGLRLLPDVAPGPSPEHPAEPSTGAAYLVSRREEFARRDAARTAAESASARALEALAPLARESRAEPPSPSRGALASLAFLIPRDQLEQFREAVRGLRVGSTESILLSGPWPPYHFAEPPDAEPS
jgi:hypothetical protein